MPELPPEPCRLAPAGAQVPESLWELHRSWVWGLGFGCQQLVMAHRQIG